jgi:CBS-domain-containing membrane protein
VKAALGSLRSLLFGETWTIPLGVAVMLATALLLRASVPAHTWSHAGGFVIAALLTATLAISWRGSAS